MMMTTVRRRPAKTRLRWLAALAGLAALAVMRAAEGEALALDANQAAQSAQQQIAAASAGLDAINAAITRSVQAERTPAQRIADAVLLVGSKDYARASTVLNEIIEKYPQHPTAYPDALALLGETYYLSKQYLSARRTYQLIADRAADERFANYQPKALGRLVDLALRTKDYSKLDDIFASMARVPPGRATGSASEAPLACPAR